LIERESEHLESAVVTDDDPALKDALRTLTPSAREHLRDVLIRDDADRQAIASQLMRYRDENGQGWADIVDLLTMYPEARRRVTRILGEIEATRAYGDEWGEHHDGRGSRDHDVARRLHHRSERRPGQRLRGWR
jgi:hypothetical protein